MSMEKTALVRKVEAKNAAAIIGSEYIRLDFEDKMLFDGIVAAIIVRYFIFADSGVSSSALIISQNALYLIPFLNQRK